MLRNSRKTVPKHVTALSRKRSFSPLFHSSGKWNGAAKVNGQHLSLYQSLALSFISHTHKRTLSNKHPHLNLQSSHSRTHSFSLSLHHTNTFFSQALTLTLKHKYAPFLSHSLFLRVSHKTQLLLLHWFWSFFSHRRSLSTKNVKVASIKRIFIFDRPVAIFILINFELYFSNIC